MKAKIILGLVALLFIAAFIWGFRRLGNLPPDPDDAPPITAPKAAAADADAGLTLEPAAQKLIGLQTAKIAATTLPPEVPAFGRVLDPAPLIGLVKDLAGARNDLAASTKAHQRIKALYSQGLNASAQAMETADAAVQRDQIAASAAQAQLESAWGKTIARMPDLPTFVRSLADLETVIVRLDVPAGEWMEQLPVGGQLLPPGRGAAVDLRFFGRALATDPQIQGEAFLFLAKNASGSLTPGLAWPGRLLLPGKARAGVIVPADAVVRSGDRAWIYVQTGDKKFERRMLTLDEPVAGGWFAAGGIAANDRAVVVGAQALLSEEMKSQIKTDD